MLMQDATLNNSRLGIARERNGGSTKGQQRCGRTSHLKIARSSGGKGGPLLVLLHGLGATGGVWAEMLSIAGNYWDNRWVAFDLPGHGASDRLPSYRNEDYAAALAPEIAEMAHGQAVALLGHSLGGTVSLTLASGQFGIIPQSAHAIGIKVDWSEEELARFDGLAKREPREFDSEQEAIVMHSRYAGLASDAQSALLENGARPNGDKWQAALDLAAFAVVPPDMPSLVANARCPIHLSCGAGDPMISVDRLRQFDPGAIEFGGCGHNAMVDDPASVWKWFAGRQ